MGYGPDRVRLAEIHRQRGQQLHVQVGVVFRGQHQNHHPHRIVLRGTESDSLLAQPHRDQRLRQSGQPGVGNRQPRSDQGGEKLFAGHHLPQRAVAVQLREVALQNVQQRDQEFPAVRRLAAADDVVRGEKVVEIAVAFCHVGSLLLQ